MNRAVQAHCEARCHSNRRPYGTAAACLVATIVHLAVTEPRRVQAQGMGVIDLPNLAQNLITAIETVDQYLTQIQQYQLQFMQVEDMIKNGAAPAVYVWDKVNSISENVQRLDETVLSHTYWVDSMDDYLQRFGDLDYYRSAKCYGGDLSCTQSEWDRIIAEAQDQHGLAAQKRKQTIDDLIKTLARNAEQMEDDSDNLDSLRRNSEKAGTQGHMAVAQAGNQLASAQTQQLMQIRALMVAQQQAVAVEMQSKAADDARALADNERFFRKQAERSQQRDLNPWID